MSDVTFTRDYSRVAVKCTYYGPTNTKGSRWKVCRADWTREDYNWDPDQAPLWVPCNVADEMGASQGVPGFMAAIRLYLEKIGWHGTWSVGYAGTGVYVAVLS